MLASTQSTSNSSQALDGTWQCDNVPEVAGCRASFTYVPRILVGTTAVLPTMSKISFVFNNTRAHALEWRVDNTFVRKAYAQSVTDTYEAPDGSVLFGYAENSVSMVYQLTKIVSLTEPPRCEACAHVSISLSL